MHKPLPEDIGVIGAGRLGLALGRSLADADVNVCFCLDIEMAQAERVAHDLPGCRAYTDLAVVEERPSLVFAAVPDRAIADLGEALSQSPLNRPGVIFVHGSGLWPAATWGETAPALRASFHPVMLFTGAHPASFKDVPVALEGDSGALSRLEALAQLLGASPFRIAAEAKTAYHAACTMASNLLIGLLDATQEVAETVRPAEGLGWLWPLIKATLDEAIRLGPARSLTGPVARGDAATVERHAETLAQGHPQTLEIYRTISRRLLDIADLDPQERDAIRKIFD